MVHFQREVSLRIHPSQKQALGPSLSKLAAVTCESQNSLLLLLLLLVSKTELGSLQASNY